MHIEHETLGAWPFPPTKNRRASQFRMAYPGTLEKLRDELERISAREISLQTGIPYRHVRMDGFPRADAPKPVFPGVILAFVVKAGDLVYPCDTYTDWQSNLHAIGLTLEALRALDRYGAAGGRQYTGFRKALPPGDGLGSREHAALLLRTLSGIAVGPIEDAYKAAVRKHHTDVGGDRETFDRIQAAWELLRR